MKRWTMRACGLATLALFVAAGQAMAQQAAASGAAVAQASEQEIARGIQAGELLARIEEGMPPMILDVRSPEEYAEGHIPGAINIPYADLEQRASELGIDPSEELVVYCRTGRRAAIAEATLHELGYMNLKDLEGHIAHWKEEGLPLE